MIQKDSSAVQILMPFSLSHRCALCGCSCMAQLVGPLSELECMHIREAFDEFSSKGECPVGVNPFMKGTKADGTVLQFLNFPQKKCFFLNKDNLCSIHAAFNANQKPAACRRFPHFAIRAENEVRVSIKPYCYANARSCCLDFAEPDLLSRYARDLSMRALMDDLVANAAVRPVVRVCDAQEIARGLAQERRILAWLEGDVSLDEFLGALVHGEVCGRRPERMFFQDLSRVLPVLSQALAQDLGEIAQSNYARHVRALLDLMKSPVAAFAPLPRGDGFWKFAKFSLYNAVFLRETSRFPDVRSGTFALALGCVVALQDRAHANDHLVTWFRIFAQTKAFEYLMPTPQAMSMLTRGL